MDVRHRWIAGGAIGLLVVATGAGYAIAGAGDDDRPLAGRDLRQASVAALAHTGGGTVIETEAGDEGAAYGVEVRLENGAVVEVALDARFHVIGEERDEDAAGPEDDDAAGVRDEDVEDADAADD